MTTGSPSPCGTPHPQYTGDARRAIQSSGNIASRQIGVIDAWSEGSSENGSIPVPMEYAVALMLCSPEVVPDR